MKQLFISKQTLATLFGLGLLLTACSTISKFDQYAYTQTTSLKVDAISVMGQAHDSFPLHQQEVQQVQTALSKMYEYEKNRPKNAITQKMWTVLTDSTGNLYGGFIKRWQKEGTLDTAFIRISQDLVSQSFDQISQLESGKIKPSQTY
jgi:hypothetical protein